MEPLPKYGPLPKPVSLDEAREVLKAERFSAPRLTVVEFTATEWSSICPRTGQPDFGTVKIRYTPHEFCIESKALKFYLWAYRDEGAFCEQLAALIADDVFNAVLPWDVQVTVCQNTRGGIALQATAERSKRRGE